MAAPVPKDEPERAQALREYHILDTAPEEAYDDVVRLAAYICGTRIAAITLIDDRRQWFKSIFGLTIQEIPRDLAFCAHTILQSGLTVVPDTRLDPRFVDNPFVTGEPRIRFYAGSPLITEDNYALGSLCVLDTTARILTAEQRDALATLARHVMVMMTLRRQTAIREQLEAAVVNAVEGITLADARLPDLPVSFCNPAFLVMTGYEEGEVLGRNCRFLQGPDTDPNTTGEIRAALLAGRPCRVTLRNYRKDGVPFWNELTISPVRDAGGSLTHYVGLQHDVTALKDVELVLRQSEARLVEAQRIASIGDWTLDVATRRFTWSAELFRLLEFDPAQGEPAFEAVLARYHPDDRAEHDRLFTQALASGEPYQCDLRLLLPSGSPRWCRLIGRSVFGPAGSVVQVIGTAQDVTELKQRETQVLEANTVLEVQRTQLKAINEELQELVTTDPLTGLLNYRAFQARLVEETRRAEREGGTLAVVVLDLDNFRFFDDQYGHTVGDTVLRQVAARLREVCGEEGVAARFGGDEFTLLLPDIGVRTLEEVEAWLRKSLSGLSYQPPGEPLIVPITLSLGAALFADGAREWHQVQQKAEDRLRRDKEGWSANAEAIGTREANSHIKGFSMLDALVTAVDNKDHYTRRHSEDVLTYSLQIATGLGMDERARHTVAVAALLHDVGKIGVPDRVLRKPGRLTDEEFEAIKQHPMMGAVIVGAVPGLEETLDAVRHHHERWDGGGYPFGLRGEECPLVARLMAVADAFSAMTTDRPYRRGMEREKALAILRDGAGTQWDPQCVAVFLRTQPVQ